MVQTDMRLHSSKTKAMRYAEFCAEAGLPQTTVDVRNRTIVHTIWRGRNAWA